MLIRWDPIKQRFPGFSGKYMVDTWRGQLRVRSWPRKRGPSKSAAVRKQNEWFTRANLLAKHCAASQQRQAIAMTLGTGLYPRDLLLKCMSRGIIAPVTASGRVLEYRRPKVDAVSFQGFRLRLAAPFNIGIGVEQAPDWPLPVFDTASFWDPAQVNQITIPPGVEIMSFTAGARTNGSPGGFMSSFIWLQGVANYARSDSEAAGQHASNCSTGPIPVVPGQVWKARFFLSAGGGNIAAVETFFTGTIEQAV